MEYWGKDIPDYLAEQDILRTNMQTLRNDKKSFKIKS